MKNNIWASVVIVAILSTAFVGIVVNAATDTRTQTSERSISETSTRSDLKEIRMVSLDMGWKFSKSGNILRNDSVNDMFLPIVLKNWPLPKTDCSVTCGADAGGWWCEITCESGSYTFTSRSITFWDPERGWVTAYSIDRTYDESGNTYHLSAEYWRISSGGEIVGRIKLDVTGGVFGNNEQHCQNY